MAYIQNLRWRYILMAIGLIALLLNLLKRTSFKQSPPLYIQYDLPYDLDFFSNISSRQASIEKSWDDAVYYGNWLICLMNAPLTTLTQWQSQWTVSTTRTLDIHGWERTVRTVSDQDNFDSLALNSALHDLGIDTTYTEWKTITDHHWNTRPPYQATGARYNNWYSVKDGVVIAKDNYSPDYYAAKKGIDKSKVPPLKQWSDLVYLSWASMTSSGPQRENINHVFRYNIANANTHKMLKLAMGNGDINAAPPLTPWPGISWTIDDASGQAAFSNSNAYGVAYFLLTHKAQLGVRIVDRVHVFNCPAVASAEMWRMYFHIREGPIEGRGSSSA